MKKNILNVVLSSTVALFVFAAQSANAGEAPAKNTLAPAPTVNKHATVLVIDEQPVKSTVKTKVHYNLEHNHDNAMQTLPLVTEVTLELSQIESSDMHLLEIELEDGESLYPNYRKFTSL